MKRYLPALILMAVIFIFSSLPSSDLPDFGFWDLLAKKGGHMLGYGMLALAYLYALRTDNRLGMRHFLIAWLLSILYAASDEYHQSFVPGRGATIFDIGIDGLGAGVALLIYWGLIRNKEDLQKSGNE